MIQFFKISRNTSHIQDDDVMEDGPFKLAVKSHDDEKRKTLEYLTKVTARLPRSPNDYPSPIAHFPITHSSTCLITKNGNSVIRYVNCLLGYAEAHDTRSFDLLSKEETLKGAHSRKCYASLSRRRRKFKRIRSELTIFVRDPLDRFVSGWLFLCKKKNICFDCSQNDFACFLTTLYNCWRTKRRYSKICRFDYRRKRRSKHNTSTYLYWHVLPQAAFCQLYRPNRHFTIMNYSRESINEYLLDAAKSLLNEQQVSDLEERLNQKTSHAANETKAEELKELIISDKRLTNMFIQLYFIDYRTFDIDIPNFVVDFQLYKEKEKEAESGKLSNGTGYINPLQNKSISSQKAQQINVMKDIEHKDSSKLLDEPRKTMFKNLAPVHHESESTTPRFPDRFDLHKRVDDV